MRTIPFKGTSQTISGHNPVTESINQHPGILDRHVRKLRDNKNVYKATRMLCLPPTYISNSKS